MSDSFDEALEAFYPELRSALADNNTAAAQFRQFVETERRLAQQVLIKMIAEARADAPQDALGDAARDHMRRQPGGEEFLEQEDRMPDGNAMRGGITAGGIFGDGVVPLEQYDPNAALRERLLAGSRAPELPSAEDIDARTRKLRAHAHSDTPKLPSR